MWPWKRKKPAVPDTPEGAKMVDMSADSIDLDDPDDPNSLFMQLAMSQALESDDEDSVAAVIMHYDEKTGGWVIHAGDKTYEGATQMEALMKANLKDETKGNA